MTTIVLLVIAVVAVEMIVVKVVSAAAIVEVETMLVIVERVVVFEVDCHLKKEHDLQFTILELLHFPYTCISYYVNSIENVC